MIQKSLFQAKPPLYIARHRFSRHTTHALCRWAQATTFIACDGESSYSSYIWQSGSFAELSRTALHGGPKFEHLNEMIPTLTNKSYNPWSRPLGLFILRLQTSTLNETSRHNPWDSLGAAQKDTMPRSLSTI